MRAAIITLCLLWAAAPVAQDLSERLAACNACHGERGEGREASEYYPHLAGKPAGYLLDQLEAFREGRRVYPQMNWLMRNMSDGYLAAIAQHFATFEPRTQAVTPAVGAAIETRARQLVEQGDPARHIPPCSACHGANLAGLEPGVPALVGLPTDYVIAQLGAWRTGVRIAREPDCMADIAKALEPNDLRILGTWLSAQGHAESVRPAAPGSFTPPRACGSLDAAASVRDEPPSEPRSASPAHGAPVEPPPQPPAHGASTEPHSAPSVHDEPVEPPAHPYENEGAA